MSIPQTPSPLSNILTAKTYNAAWFSGSTKEAQITTAIAAAVTDGALYVYVPANMLPYSPSLVVFNNTIHVISEGSNPTEFNVRSYGASGNGIADDTPAILAAEAGAVAFNLAINAGVDLNFPPGTYVTSQNLTVGSHRWKGSGPYGTTVIKPTAAVTKCLIVSSQTTIHDLYLDGINTNGATGLSVGETILVNQIEIRALVIQNFLGVGARGCKVAQLVTGFFENCYWNHNYINLHCNGGNTPTDTIWLNCQFRTATTKGVWLETGYGLRFIKPLFESNGEEGLYLQNVGGTLTEVTVDDAWYELNWTSVPSGAARHAKFNCFVDGANGPGGTLRFAHLCAKFLESGTEARAIHLTNCTIYADFNSKVNNEAGQILIDGLNGGAKFTCWSNQNGPFATTVTDNTGIFDAVICAESRIIDIIDPAWLTWAPTISASGAMTVTAQTLTLVKYKIIGKSIYIKLQFTVTLGGVANSAIIVPMPTNVRSLNAADYASIAVVDNAINQGGYARADGSNPTSNLQITRWDNAVWTLGAGRSAVINLYHCEAF